MNVITKYCISYFVLPHFAPPPPVPIVWLRPWVEAPNAPVPHSLQLAPLAQPVSNAVASAAQPSGSAKPRRRGRHGRRGRVVDASTQAKDAVDAGEQKHASGESSRQKPVATGQSDSTHGMLLRRGGASLGPGGLKPPPPK